MVSKVVHTGFHRILDARRDVRSSSVSKGFIEQYVGGMRCRLKVGFRLKGGITCP